MRQASLWSTKEELARTELWDGLPEAVRREFVDRLVHIVVGSIMKPKEARKKQGGEYGVESAAKPSRT